MKCALATSSFLLFLLNGYSQNYPSYGAEIDVTINGLTFDAMEPNLSHDGSTLFFNNKNDGITTKLFYATYINDSTFNFVGELNGTNQTVQPYLDAVADIDSSGYFLWTSTRNYPTVMENLHYGYYDNGTVSNIGRVYGDFNIYNSGWLIMDHGITIDGQHVFINNAYYNNCNAPCSTYMKIAQRVNDSTFNVISNSDGILMNINDSANYIYYASCITTDEKELYYTRYPTGTVTTSTPIDICVAVRDTEIDTFSAPYVLITTTVLDIAEAPTLSDDKMRMYYHKKVGTTYLIKLRYRDSGAHITESHKAEISIYPNPSTGTVMINHLPLKYMNTGIKVFTLDGKELLNLNKSVTSDGKVFLELPQGEYRIVVFDNNKILQSKSVIIY